MDKIKGKIKGSYIEYLKAIDEKTIELKLRNGDVHQIKSVMIDFDECALRIQKAGD